jgi:hypothetical protein
MMEKGQDQIPDEGFLMTKMPMYLIVTVDKIILCLADPSPGLTWILILTLTLILTLALALTLTLTLTLT